MGALERGLGGGCLLLNAVKLLPRLPGLRLQLRRLLAYPLNFRPAGQQPRPLHMGAAGQGTAGVDYLSVQGHHPETVAVFSGNSGRGV